MSHELNLLRVEKPARYIGGELGSRRKESAELRFVLAFPDVYEVGMSHLGLQILYRVLNELDGVAAERAYAPWPDLHQELAESGTPLATLETGTTLADADILGFTLQYELSYTNILAMMSLAGIPLLAAERDERNPLILGGGPCAFNPEPLADFFDAFLLGDGEEAAIEIAQICQEAKKEQVPRVELLRRLAAVPGVYVPSFFRIEYDDVGRIAAIEPLLEGYRTVRRRFLADLDSATFPTSPIVPFLKTIHDRVAVEIARGCTRGCRFCQAGYIYRPVRERSPERLLEIIDEALRQTGYEEISLLSLSSGDYSCIAPLITTLMARYAGEKIAVSLPSLRVGTLTEELVEEVKKVRKTGFTLAPEAGSERLRAVINKGISEEDLVRTATAVYGAGWRLIKLYFMLGLPTETTEDIEGIVELSSRVKREGKRAGTGGDVNVAVSSFVPKAHTPFQWEPQIGYDEILSKQQFLRQELKKKRLVFKWQDAHLTLLEGVFARGDRRLGRLLLAAHRLGCSFDGWGDRCKFHLWQEAFRETGIDPDFYLRRREPEELLPWDHLDCGVTREYLLQERARSLAGTATVDCRTGACTGCGVCDFSTVAMRLNESGAVPSAPPREVRPAIPAEEAARIRVRFGKTGTMRYLSHLEMISLFTRAVGRTRLPIRFSQGFHPHPRFSFATALSVGIESLAEYMDLEVARGCSAEQVATALNETLPEGIKILAAAEIPLQAPALSVIMERVRYRITLPVGTDIDLAAAAARFLEEEHFPVRREKRSRVSEFDLRQELHELSTVGNALEMVVGRGKPLEFLAAITGLSSAELVDSRIEKLAVIFRESPGPGLDEQTYVGVKMPDGFCDDQSMHSVRCR